MTLSTATLERLTTATAALTPITETPITRDATLQEFRDHADEYTFLLYVTRISDYMGPDTITGRIVKVAPTSTSHGWLYRHTNGMLYRVFGAVLNEPMANGRYYRQLGDRNMLVRYNDEDHRGDRHSASIPLSIIAAEGAPWPFPSDAMGMWDDSVPYIQVEAPAEVPAPATAEASPIIADPWAMPTDPVVELTDAQQFVTDITVSGPTRGFAEPEADGRVALDPELVPGGIYLFWSTNRAWDRESMVEARMYLRTPEDGEPEFSYLGYWTMEREGIAHRPVFYSSRRTVLDRDVSKGWAKLALAEPTASRTNDDATVWMNRMASEAGQFVEFNEATNQLAEDHEWCEEYEGIITAVGMEGRSKQLYDWDVSVSVDFSFEADNIPGRIDTQVAETYDIPGISLNSARFRGTATITILVSDQEDSSDAEEQIDSDMVYEALSDMMSGVDDIEVDDYSVRHATQR